MENLKSTFERLESHVKLWHSQGFVHEYSWSEGIAQDPSLTEMGKHLGKSVENVREDVLNLVPLIPQRRAADREMVLEVPIRTPTDMSEVTEVEERCTHPENRNGYYDIK